MYTVEQQNGVVSISTQVLKTIVEEESKQSISVCLKNQKWGGVFRFLGESIRVQDNNGEIVIDMDIEVSYGVPILSVVEMLQAAIHDAIKMYVGVPPKQVNVRITRLILPKE